MVNTILVVWVVASTRAVIKEDGRTLAGFDRHAVKFLVVAFTLFRLGVGHGVVDFKVLRWLATAILNRKLDAIINRCARRWVSVVFNLRIGNAQTGLC